MPSREWSITISRELVSLEVVINLRVYMFDAGFLKSGVKYYLLSRRTSNI